jgi:hypothetical protein
MLIALKYNYPYAAILFRCLHIFGIRKLDKFSQLSNSKLTEDLLFESCLVEVLIFCRSYLLKYNTTIEFDAAVYSPFKSLNTQIQLTKV